MRNLTTIWRSGLALAALGCGFRADPVKVDAAVQPPRPADGAAADVAMGSGDSGTTPDGGTTDVPAVSGDGGATDVPVISGEAGPPASSRLFPESSPWYRDVSGLPADIESPALIAALAT